MIRDPQKTPLVWIDLETTGLDPLKDIILEIALVITTPELAIIHQTSYALRPKQIPAISEFVTQMHLSNGLLAQVADGMHLEYCDELLANVVRDNDALGGPICGASPHFDMSFLRVHMPKLAACFNHHTFDVSTLKHAYRIWEADLPKDSGIETRHRALSDILGTIEECRRLKKWIHEGVS